MKYHAIPAAAISLALLGGCLETTGPQCHRVTSTPVETRGDTVVTASGLRYIDVTAGTGEEARLCTSLTLHYTGSLTNGQVFDSSRGEDRSPLGVFLGGRQVIAGFEEGLLGMRVGGTRRLIIPPQLGYGAAPQPGIPANSTLIFDLELLEVRR